jgi:hypothetical protein
VLELKAVFAGDPVAARIRSRAIVRKHRFWSTHSIRRLCRQPDHNKAMDCNCVGQFEISVLGSLKLRCQELVKFSGLQRPSLFIRNDDLPSLAGPNARLGDRYQHADPLAAYFLVLSCRYNLICQPGGSSIRTSPKHLVLPLWLQFAVKVTIWGQTLAERAPPRMARNGQSLSVTGANAGLATRWSDLRFRPQSRHSSATQRSGRS